MTDQENQFVKELINNMNQEELKHFASKYLFSIMKDQNVSANLMHSKFLRTKIAS